MPRSRFLIFDSYPNARFKNLSGRIRILDQQKVANGGFSDVYLGELVSRLRPTRMVAVKALRGVHLRGAEARAKLIQRLYREAGLWCSLNHPNVLPFLGLSEESICEGCPALVSPYCRNGTVFEYVQAYPHINRLPIIRGIANGLQYLHSQTVVHGDLKVDNILMSDTGQPLLCDFGRSKFETRRGFTTVFTGACNYMAPELFQQGDTDASEPTTTKASDVYAFSLVCVEVLSGQRALPRFRMEHQLMAFVVNGGRPRRDKLEPLPVEPTNWIWPILEACWQHNPYDRPTMKNIAELLKD
ncbi:TKL/TKL-ccin protein kinase [Coprinopsis cinerea okayama7|uniref:TKL/TKL-ccin protein kinase n=1 Tax=Coprinopsis cinerea (strain Okayama-7 / 130 / ATCC MYA-4618 / FGSC 9003) TaxID=240176 RepID=A8P294_COPC7|nr:TKL/TKL-ccin protein kinase [Coprinopsis cinerea okayama7\|eukprot:XP_001838265.2 TKL/TKL-ccin protein kinase [Coprinopsis cinerea okayama7\